MALTSITQDFVVKSGLTVLGTSSPITTSTSNPGTLQVNGGVGIAKDILIGTTATIYGQTNLLGNVVATNNLSVGGIFTATGATVLSDTLYVGNNSNFVGALNTFSGAVIITGSNTLSVGGAVDFGSSLDIGGNLNLKSTTTAASAGGGSGALKVLGGVYIGDNLIVNSTASSTSTNATNAVYIAGGAWIDKTLSVHGPALFTNDVTFSGTATYVYSTNTVYTDNLIELHTPPGGVGATWTSSDGKDIGFRFHYYNGGADKNAAIVLQQDVAVFEFYSSGAEGTTTFAGSAYAGTKALSSVLTDTTDATTTQSGALQVAGGAGIGLSLYAGLDVSASSVHVRSLSNTRVVYSDSNHNLVDSSNFIWDNANQVLKVGAGGTEIGGDAGYGYVKAQFVQATSLTNNRLVFSDVNNKLVDSASLTWNSSLSQVEGRVAYANTATHLAGGANLNVPYQTAANTTAFVSAPTAQGQVLAYNAGTGQLEWVLASADNANNLRGGLKYSIPYQLTTSTTTTTNHLTYNYDNLIFSVDNVSIYASGTNATAYGSDNAVVSTAGQSIGLWSDTGTSLGVGTGTFKLSSTGTAILSGTGFIEADTLRARNKVYVSGTEASSTTTATAGALQVAGGVGISGGLYVDQNAYVNADLYVQGTLYVQGNSLDGVDTITGSTGTFIDVSSTGTVYANVIQSTGVANFNDIKVTGQGTFTNAITVGTATNSQVVSALYSNNIVLASYTSPAISGTAKVYLDTYLASQYRTSKYLVQVIDGGSVYVTELSMFWIGSSVYLSEYGINTNNGALGTFDASKLITGEVELTFTPNGATSMTIKVVRLGITA